MRDYDLIADGYATDRADAAGITGTMNGVTFHYQAVASYRTLQCSSASRSSAFTMTPA